MAATPDGGGYWLVASDGGIFAYGDAQFYGSTGSIHLNQPVVGHGGGARVAAATGSWPPTAASSATASASFLGSMGATPLNAPIVGMAGTANGYWLAAKDGGVFNFGTAPFLGSMGGQSNPNPIRAIAATPSGQGYWLLPDESPAAPAHPRTRGERGGGGLPADAAAGSRLLGRHHERLLRRQHRAGRLGAAEGGQPPPRRRRGPGHLGCPAGRGRPPAAPGSRDTRSRSTSRTT